MDLSIHSPNLVPLISGSGENVLLEKNVTMKLDQAFLISLFLNV